VCCSKAVRVMAMTVAIIVALLVGCCVDVATSDALTQEERAYSVACVPYTGSPATAGKCDHVIPPSSNVFLAYLNPPPPPLSLHSILF
jgi:hypothetical protein